MSDEQNIKDQPEDNRPPTTDDREKSADDTSVKNEENETIAEENIQHSTLNIQQNKEKMEIHHHGHVHENKKWKEYLFQFFMLFLAVFCGFLAEYQLEHMIEKQREKKYMQSLVQNLESDTTSIRIAINGNERKQAAFYSLLLLADADLSLPKNSYLFYNYFISGSFIPLFTPNDAGITQLINGGNLRLISKRNVSDSILNYDAFKKRILQHNEVFSQSGDEIWNSVYPIAHAKVFSDTSYIEFFNARKFKNKQPPPLTLNAANLQVFFGQVSRNLLLAQVNRRAIIQQKNRAERLIKFLKQEYHLENE
jgi:hypothetical protein